MTLMHSSPTLEATSDYSLAKASLGSMTCFLLDLVPQKYHAVVKGMPNGGPLYVSERGTLLGQQDLQNSTCENFFEKKS